MIIRHCSDWHSAMCHSSCRNCLFFTRSSNSLAFASFGLELANLSLNLLPPNIARQQPPSLAVLAETSTVIALNASVLPSDLTRAMLSFVVCSNGRQEEAVARCHRARHRCRRLHVGQGHRQASPDHRGANEEEEEASHGAEEAAKGAR